MVLFRGRGGKSGTVATTNGGKGRTIGASTSRGGAAPSNSSVDRQTAQATGSEHTLGTQSKDTRSSQSSNPSTTGSVSRNPLVRLPSQYPSHAQAGNSSLLPLTPQAEPQQILQQPLSQPHLNPSPGISNPTQPPFYPQDGLSNPADEELHEDGTEEDEEEEVLHGPPDQHVEEDFQGLVDSLLALPGRQNLPLLSPTRIPGVKSIWFRRGDKGKLSRVIAGIFRRNFNGPYYSWNVTPIHIQELFWRKFVRKYNWDIAITDLVKQEFLKVAQRRMKGIVSQVKRKGKQPLWIKGTLWEEMCAHWKTPESVSKSQTTSDARNSHRGGLGRHIHVTGQWSYNQLKEEMEEELQRHVSLGEVFIKAHTRKDGTFVDDKAKNVAAVYQMNVDARGLEMANDQGEGDATPRQLTIAEKDHIFMQSTVTNRRGTRFGLGSLAEVIDADTSQDSARCSSSTIEDMKTQLEEAQRKIVELAADKARRDQELKDAKAASANIQATYGYFKDKDPGFVAYLTSLSPQPAQPSKGQDNSPLLNP